MKISERYFSQLTTLELYEILALRSEVFIVEQQCYYQDVDGLDQHATHLLCTQNGELVAYSRWYKREDEIVLGRVLSKGTHRGLGMGQELMTEAMKRIGDANVTIHAQQRLTRFYRGYGFVEVGEAFMEDGLPHIRMERQLD